MKFSANRKIMLEYLKSMVRIVPGENVVKELTGFLIEANEDEGFLYITATNSSVAMQRKFKPVIETGGSFVIKAQLITKILDALKGETVYFEQISSGVVRIKAGNSKYDLKVIGAEKYPKPNIPLPGSTVHISNLSDFYTKVSASVGTASHIEVLKGINFDIHKNKLRVISCDTQRIALATMDLPCGRELKFTISKNDFSYLKAAVGNSEIEVGICNNTVVFLMEGLLFSARIFNQEYMNIDGIFKKLENDYVAKVELSELKVQVMNICYVAKIGSETAYIKLDFKDDRIEMSTEHDSGLSTNTVDAVFIEGNHGKSYYYRVQALEDIFKTVEGTILIRLAKNGYLVVMDKSNQYLIMNTPVVTVNKQLEKYEEIKKKPKTVKKSKTSTNAQTNKEAA